MERKGPNPPNSARARLPGGSQGPLGPVGRYGYRKAWRQEMAQKLRDARENRTPEQQLALLDSRLGAGIGARKERARLKSLIDARDGESSEE